MSAANKATLINTGVRYGVPIIVGGIGVYAVKKMLSKKNADGTSSSIAPALSATTIDSSKLTISVSDAALFANTLYGAMLNFGTDEDTIISTIDKIQTKDDMLLVIKTFGMKKYLWGTRALLLGQNYNLIGWLRFELGKRDIAKIKPRFDNWGIPL